MSVVQQFLVAVAGIGLVTALVLPDRQTARVIDALGNAGQGLLGTAISGRA